MERPLTRIPNRPWRVLSTTRGRLTLIWVVVFTVALAVANLGLYLTAMARMFGTVDEELRTHSVQVASSLRYSGGHLTYAGDRIPLETPSGRAVDVAVVGPDGAVLQEADLPLSAAELRNLAAPVLRSHRASLVDFTDEKGVHRRACVVPVGSLPGQHLVVISSMELPNIDATFRQTTGFTALFSLGLLSGSAALVYWLIGRVLRPVSQIANLAESLSERDLDRRVDVPAPDDEVGDLVRTFNRMLGRLEESFLTLRRFTADASHELRSPLALMATELEYALARQRSDSERERILRGLQEEVRHMTDMVEKLLMLTRADSGQLRPARRNLDVADFVYETTARWHATAAPKSVRLEVDVPDSGTMLADPHLTRRILDNLIANAIRHSPAGGRLSVSASRRPDGWVLEVGDQGPGVPPGQRERIFKRFARADSARTREAERGVGLGLPLSVAYAEAQGGRLGIVERPRWGAVFRLWLPDPSV